MTQPASAPPTESAARTMTPAPQSQRMNPARVAMKEGRSRSGSRVAVSAAWRRNPHALWSDCNILRSLPVSGQTIPDGRAHSNVLSGQRLTLPTASGPGFPQADG